MRNKISGNRKIQKSQSETKDTLIETKNNLRETAVEWIKVRIKSII